MKRLIWVVILTITALSFTNVVKYKPKANIVTSGEYKSIKINNVKLIDIIKV